MALPVLEVHTPSSSFAVPHSLTGDNLPSLFNRLSNKLNTQVGPGWVKYEYNGGYWDLSDDADYSIFAWRLAPADASSASPVIFVHDPLRPLPTPPAYQNFSYYAFRPKPDPIAFQESTTKRNSSILPGPAGPFVPEDEKRKEELARSRGQGQSQGQGLHRRGTMNTVASAARSVRSSKSRRSTKYSRYDGSSEEEYDVDGNVIPKYKRDFLKFHGGNGNRVVVGTFGPVKKVEMLLKKGYSHVYMSRHFAKRHGLVPPEVAPGWMGYSGLVNMGQIPITIGTKTTTHTVYLAEENQFDVVLGRAFMEARRIQTDPTDFSSIVCLDNGDKLDCKVVVIRDGRGDFVTVP